MGKMRRWLFVFSAVLGGCAINPVVTDSEGNHRINRALDDIVCGGISDREACRGHFSESNQNGAFNRLLRAHVMVTAMARLGAARRFESTEPAVESMRLLQAIQKAEDRLVEACTTRTLDNATERMGYPVPRAEALIAVASVAVAATRPSRARILDIASLEPATAAEKGAAALTDLVKDMIYADAYTRTLRDQVAAIALAPADFSRAWTQRSHELEGYCRDLAATAKVPDATCLPKDREAACLDRVPAVFAANP